VQHPIAVHARRSYSGDSFWVSSFPSPIVSSGCERYPVHLLDDWTVNFPSPFLVVAFMSTTSGFSGVKDLAIGSGGEKLSAHRKPGYLWPLLCVVHGIRENFLATCGDRISPMARKSQPSATIQDCIIIHCLYTRVNLIFWASTCALPFLWRQS
jgi:hypothetical protein